MANPYAGIPNGYQNGGAANMQQYPQNYPQNAANVQQMQTAPAMPVTGQQTPQAQLIPFTQIVAAWVQDADIGQRMMVEPNKIAVMIDEAHNKIYVKTTDSLGRQSPMQTYENVTPPADVPQVDLSGYVTKQDFTDLSARFGDLEDKIARLFESLAPKKRTKREESDDGE